MAWGWWRGSKKHPQDGRTGGSGINVRRDVRELWLRVSRVPASFIRRQTESVGHYLQLGAGERHDATKPPI